MKEREEREKDKSSRIQFMRTVREETLEHFLCLSHPLLDSSPSSEDDGRVPIH